MTVIPSSTRTVDVMEGAERWHHNITEHGFVALVDVMPRMVPEGQTADFAIVQAARVSYGPGTKKVSEDRGLIRYLMRNRHTTPFEMIEFKFHCAMPIFVARQWIRHRTANVNEMSGRYSILPNRFYYPDIDNVRRQGTANRQGGDDLVGEATATDFLAWLKKADEVYKDYEKFVDKGISREQARMNLPLNIYTEWYWKIDLHNLMHFLSLRMDSHAQEEIRVYGNAMFDMVKKVCPISMEAFEDYRLNGIHLTGLEIEAIRENIDLDTTNKREIAEWEDKKKKLNL